MRVLLDIRDIKVARKVLAKLSLPGKAMRKIELELCRSTMSHQLLDSTTKNLEAVDAKLVAQIREHSDWFMAETKDRCFGDALQRNLPKKLLDDIRNPRKVSLAVR